MKLFWIKDNSVSAIDLDDSHYPELFDLALKGHAISWEDLTGKFSKSIRALKEDAGILAPIPEPKKRSFWH